MNATRDKGVRFTSYKVDTSEGTYRVNFIKYSDEVSWKYKVYHGNGRQVREDDIPATVREWGRVELLKRNRRTW